MLIFNFKTICNVHLLAIYFLSKLVHIPIFQNSMSFRFKVLYYAQLTSSIVTCDSAGVYSTLYYE